MRPLATLLAIAAISAAALAADSARTAEYDYDAPAPGSYTLPVIKPGVVAAALFGFIISFGNLEMTLFLVAPGQTTLPIAILQYLQWRIDPTIAAVSLLQIVLIGGGMLITDRYVKLTRVL